MNLTTEYLGLILAHPLMPGASPLVDDLDTVRRLEDAGASAIVMHSLFEEQITQEQLFAMDELDAHDESFAEALSFFPARGDFALGPDQYLEQIRRIREAVGVPVIASLNGLTPEGWLEYGRLIEQAGASALELNVYFLATDFRESGAQVERRVVAVLSALKQHVRIPLAMKLSPFFSSLPHVAQQLDDAGADGLVLFNRFYQPDVDPEALEAAPTLRLSEPSELLLRLRWLGILSGHLRASLAASGGVHSGLDAIKAIMCGAHAVQLVSCLLKHGPGRLRTILDELTTWMADHDYESIEQMRGSMSLLNTPQPASFERANYMRILQSWRPPAASAV